MDALLKLVADAGQHASAAEEALEAGEHQAARDALDAADDVLADLRSRWPSMASGERAVIGKTAATVRARLDAVRSRVPKPVVLGEAPAEVDPEQETDPEGLPPAVTPPV